MFFFSPLDLRWEFDLCTHETCVASLCALWSCYLLFYPSFYLSPSLWLSDKQIFKTLNFWFTQYLYFGNKKSSLNDSSHYLVCLTVFVSCFILCCFHVAKNQKKILLLTPRKKKDKNNHIDKMREWEQKWKRERHTLHKPRLFQLETLSEH